ncbi:MAG: diguanylate cyclase, partial [Candidatus Izimaplasma sp.]|nr:diguanylate cyclase [Candidatus Izimaplasma bacterium]
MKLSQRIKDNKRFSFTVFLSSFLWIFVLVLFIVTSSQTKTELISIETIRAQEHYESVLHNIFSKLETIEVFVETIGVDNLTHQDFDEFADNSDFSDIGFVSFSIAPDGVMAYYYSEDYGDDIIGLDLVNDDREHVRIAVAYAIDNKVVVINGPFDLIQGGNGLVFRKAIFEDDEFVSLINLVIDYDNLNLLFDDQKSEVVDIGVYSDDNNLLFGTLLYRDDLTYLEEIDIENVDWKIGVEVSYIYQLSTRITNIVIILISSGLYIALIIIGTEVYKNNKNLLTTQEELINFDNLTSLPNRRLLTKDVKRAIKTKEPFYLGFGDLDNFKNLNDILGHSVGDKYLEDIARRFQAIINDQLTIYRWGGDEFIFIMKTNSKEEAINLINNIYKVFEDPITINDTNYYVSISIGVVNYPINGNTMDDLIKRADIVMYDIKSQQKNTFGFFESKYLDNLKRVVDFENKVNEYSLDDFEVFLQPVLYTNNQKIFGFEGLIRLFDENNELINTQEIIRVYERKGEVSKLDEYVFEAVCKYSILLQGKFHRKFTFSFNISPITLSRDFVTFVKVMIEKYQIDPQYFVVEIIETLGFKDIEVSLKLLGELRDLGFKIAMDDFGMGYSSLSYITKLPLSIIKIDR